MSSPQQDMNKAGQEARQEARDRQPRRIFDGVPYPRHEETKGLVPPSDLSPAQQQQWLNQKQREARDATTENKPAWLK